MRAVQDIATGNTLLVALAMLLLGWSKTATFAGRQRDLEEATGLSRTTVKLALRDLVRAKLLKRESRAEGGNARNGWWGEGVRYVWQPPISEMVAGSGKHAFCDDAPASAETRPQTAPAPVDAEKPGIAAPPQSERVRVYAPEVLARRAIVVDAFAAAYERKHRVVPPLPDAPESTLELVHAAAEQLATREGDTVGRAARSIMRVFVELEHDGKPIPLAWIDRRLVQILPEARRDLARRKDARLERERETGVSLEVERERGAA
jgi:hypothetical protein